MPEMITNSGISISNHASESLCACGANEPFSALEEIIAPVHLQELLTMTDILPALLATFCTDVPQSIAGISDAIELRDAEALARAAHRISGAAGSMGGMRLVSVCRDLEKSARAGNLDSAGDMLQIIEAEYSKLCVALERIAQDENQGQSGS
jgi:HPt (histidine-containing phosphotransfer) domain-containing protein